MSHAPDTRNPVRWGAAGLGKLSCPGGIDSSELISKTATAQAEFRNQLAVREAKAELLREAIGEQAGFIQIQADLVQTFASIGDDAGVTYALKRLVAHARAAAQTANELAALNVEAR